MSVAPPALVIFILVQMTPMVPLTSPAIASVILVSHPATAPVASSASVLLVLVSRVSVVPGVLLEIEPMQFFFLR